MKEEGTSCREYLPPTHCCGSAQGQRLGCCCQLSVSGDLRDIITLVTVTHGDTLGVASDDLTSQRLQGELEGGRNHDQEHREAQP